MATNLARTGFWPFHSAIPSAIPTRRVRVASNNATGIFLGDCLRQGAAAGVYSLATAGAGVSGVSTGAEYYDPTLNGRRGATFLPAATTYTSTAFDDHGDTDQSFVLVTSDPVNTHFVAQYSAGVPALTDLTKNANFAAGAGGSTVTGISSNALDQTTLATTATLDFHVLDLVHTVLNDPTQTASAKAVVQINIGLLPPFTAAGTAGF